MKLKNTTIKLGLLFLITIGLTGCFVLGNHDEADRIDNVLEIRFNSMSMIDETATPTFDGGKNIRIEISDPYNVGAPFVAADIDSTPFMNRYDFSTYLLQDLADQNYPVMSFSGWSNFNITIYDSSSIMMFSTANWGDTLRFNDYSEPLVFDLPCEKISTDPSKWNN